MFQKTTVKKIFWPILNLYVKKNSVQARGFLASCLSPCGCVMNDGPQTVHGVLSSIGGPVPEEELSEWFAVMSRFTHVQIEIFLTNYMDIKLTCFFLSV